MELARRIFEVSAYYTPEDPIVVTRLASFGALLLAAFCILRYRGIWILEVRERASLA